MEAAAWVVETWRALLRNLWCFVCRRFAQAAIKRGDHEEAHYWQERLERTAWGK